MSDVTNWTVMRDTWFTSRDFWINMALGAFITVLAIYDADGWFPVVAGWFGGALVASGLFYPMCQGLIDHIREED